MRLLGPGLEGVDGRVGRGRGRVVGCKDVQRVVFGSGEGGRGKGVDVGEEGRGGGGLEGSGSDEVEEEEEEEGGGVPLSLHTPSSRSPLSAPNPPSSCTLTPQQLGLRRAREREMVRQAARRGVAFGFDVDDEVVATEGKRERVEMRRRVECVQGGKVVESSFAKGEWGVRWIEVALRGE